MAAVGNVVAVRSAAAEGSAIAERSAKAERSVVAEGSVAEAESVTVVRSMAAARTMCGAGGWQYERWWCSGRNFHCAAMGIWRAFLILGVGSLRTRQNSVGFWRVL